MSNKHIGSNGAVAAAEGRSNDVLSSMTLETGANLGIGGGGNSFERIVIQEVIFDPSQLDDKRIEYIKKTYGIKDEKYLKSLPQNTVLAKRVLSDRSSGESVSEYFFPFFPQHLMLPLKAGEHAWAFYEQGKNNTYGYWVCRITEPRHVDDVNHTHADRKNHVDQNMSTVDKFNNVEKTPTFDNGAVSVQAGERKNIATTASIDGDSKVYEKILQDSDSSKVTDYEPVPRYKKRPGDFVIQGSNNAVISLGTDKTSSPAYFEDDSEKGSIAAGTPKDDQKQNAGTIDIAVGLGMSSSTSANEINNSLGRKETNKDITKENKGEGNVSFEDDLGRIYLSMKTNVDQNFEINFSDPSAEGVSAAVIKVNHIRIIARESIKMIVQPEHGAPESACAGVLVKDGNVVFIPASDKYIMLGGEDANMVPLCQPAAAKAGGTVTGPPIVSTIGATVGAGGPNGQFSSKVLMK